MHKVRDLQNLPRNDEMDYVNGAWRGESRKSEPGEDAGESQALGALVLCGVGYMPRCTVDGSSHNGESDFPKVRYSDRLLDVRKRSQALNT